jgi:hypothetical protein
MTCVHCVFVQNDTTLIFTCRSCAALHSCGVGRCDKLLYNSDHTQVCALTGLCFQQRVCEAMLDSSRGSVSNQVNRDYFPRVKRDQQIKNSCISEGFIHDFIQSMEGAIVLSKRERSDLTCQTTRLWKEFVACAATKGIYIHRKDRRCFVVAVIYSLEKGICSSSGVVVYPHPKLSVRKLNKKREYGLFKVTNIRHGQRQIMSVFCDYTVLNTLCL